MAARPKTRIDLLAEALVQAQAAQAAMQSIDLRLCRGEVRQGVKAGRELLAAFIEETTTTIHRDAPDTTRV